MKELTAFDIFNLVKEAQLLVPGKIDNIYQTDDKNLYLQIYLNKEKKLLRIISGKAFFITKTRPEFPENIQRFCSFLRKYLINSRIRAIEQVDYERIIKIVLEAKNENYELFIELFGKGNIILTLNNKILSSMEEQIWADRTLKQGVDYVYPKKPDIKELFDKQREKGSTINMELLDGGFPIEAKTSLKDKEIQRIKTIIEKQTEQLNKAVKDMENNKKKGELIYEHYQELKEKIEKTKDKKMVVDL